MRSERYQTKWKQSLLAFFAENPSRAVTAKEVYDKVAEGDGALSITTVYRNLDRLVEEGLLVKGSTEGGKSATYLWVRDEGCFEHLHLQCVSCGRILHLDCHDTEEYIEHLAAEHRFRLLCGRTVLYGRCADCCRSDRAEE